MKILFNLKKGERSKVQPYREKNLQESWEKIFDRVAPDSSFSTGLITPIVMSGLLSAFPLIAGSMFSPITFLLFCLSTEGVL